MLPGSTVLSEIISRIRQKGVLFELNKQRGVFPCIFPPKREKGINHTVFLYLVHMCSRCVSFWRRNRGVYPFLVKPINLMQKVASNVI